MNYAGMAGWRLALRIAMQTVFLNRESIEMSKSLKSLCLVSVVFALGVPAIASAGSKEDLHGTSVKVSYADLNLEKAEGANVLYRRLQNAAKRACDLRTLQIHGSLRNYAEAKSCYHKALDASVARVNNAQLSKIHNS